ncbi:alpha/beta fold hydrolase [Paraglaciecola marina]|uniref:alpha/beta fold hydrolase n=1 Tax=Paraglaciecola marina TaxID=2500157 RepID=UPI00105B2B08|nr:alpha/beta hydrolase [Paraglaciecola marina]
MKLILYLGFVIAAICSSAFSFAQEIMEEPLEALPSHWSQMRIEEPVFGGQVYVVETGVKHKYTIVLVHGLGYNGLRDWMDVIPHLETNYHVVALDLPGFGESDPTSLQVAPQKYAQLLKWLIPQFSKDKVILVGHSMGGAIVLRFASEFPQQLHTLVMIDTAGVLNRSVFVRHMAQLPNRYDWLAKYQNQFGFIDSAVTKVSRFLNKISRDVLTQLDQLPDPTLILMGNELAQQYVYKDRPTLNAAIGLINEDFSEAIDNFHVPTHIIWGELDRVAPLRTGKLLASQLANAELHIIEGAGHVPMKESTEQFIEQLDLALLHSPKINNPLELSSANTMHLEDLICTGTENGVFSGHYAKVVIKGCQYITLENLTAQSISIEQSEVALTNIQIASDNVALNVKQSYVTVTNAVLEGATALKIEKSTFDGAGVSFNGSHEPIDVVADSLLYLSVSRQQKAGQVQFLHGVSQGNQFKLR